MYCRIMSTWTVLIILGIILPRFSLGEIVVSGKNEPKTMYEAVLQKCPLIQQTNLNSSDIFTKTCLDWPKINSTNKLSRDTTENIRCLVYYESLIWFCSSLGGDLYKYKNLFAIDVTKYSLEYICLGNVSLFPVNKTLEHDLAKLIPTRAECVLLCADFKSNTKVNDICQSAVYFSSFNITRLRANEMKLTGQGMKLIKPNQNEPINEVNKKKLTIQEILQPTQENSEKEAKIDNGAATGILEKPANGDKQSSDQEVAKQKNSNSDPNLPGKPEEKGDLSKDQKPAQEQVNKNTDHKVSDEVIKVLPEQSNKQPLVQDNIPSPLDETEDKSPPALNDDWMEDDQAGESDIDDSPKIKSVQPIENDEAQSESKKVKPNTVEDDPINSFNTPEDDMDGDSYFFSYFTVLMCLCIVGYVGYHNRQKVLALILEGKKNRRPGRGRRPNSANYHKLDSNLEEAISSSCTKSSNNVIY